MRITCIAEERARGLLYSVHQARRPNVSDYHDAERIADRENPLKDYHVAFHVSDPDPLEDSENPDDPEMPEAASSATTAMEDAIALFTLLSWSPDTARSGVEHVCQELARAGNRHTSYENLRLDKHARALLDVDAAAWQALLKGLLGNPNPAYAATSAGRGILLRPLIGETLPLLLRDDDLVLMISLEAPRREADPDGHTTRSHRDPAHHRLDHHRCPASDGPGRYRGTDRLYR